MHIYNITPLLQSSAVARRNLYIFACASCWSCKMNYISFRRMNNVNDIVCTGRNNMLKYIHRGYIYKCKRTYICSTGFNSINKIRHRAIIASSQYSPTLALSYKHDCQMSHHVTRETYRPET
jgi:hypothetical protein